MAIHGDLFEQYVERVYRTLTSFDRATSVERNKMLQGPDGPRQIDVVLRSRIADEEYLTIVECKDHKRPVSVDTVDAFYSKMVDLAASKGILVSRNGFSKTAKQKARRLGISLSILDKLQNRQLDRFSFIPVVVRHLQPQTIETRIDIPGPTDEMQILFSLDDAACGRPLLELLRHANVSEILEEGKVVAVFDEDTLGERPWVHTTDGNRITVKEIQVKIELTPKLHFGYADMLPSTLLKTDVLSTKESIFFANEDFDSVAQYFTEFRCFGDIPRILTRHALIATSLPSSVGTITKAESRFIPHK